MIPLFKVAMAESAAARVAETLACGFIGQGPRVEEFEAELSRRIGNSLVVTTNSNTSAIHLSLHLLKAADGQAGLMPGDEVLSTPLTCTATNWPILANGLRIRWVDVDPATLNLDLNDLECKLSPRTRAIMLVHWGGCPVDLEAVHRIQDRAEEQFGFRPAVIEDCAHAWGSTYRGRPIGNHGNLCCFSFQAIKHLTCGDGGALILPDVGLYRRAKLTRWYGIDRETNQKDFRCEADISEWGFKFHLNDINASIGLENLRIVDGVVARHRANARYYRARLREVPGVVLMDEQPDRESSYWLFTIRVERRDEFMAKMREAGIMVSRVHERNDIHSCVREFATPLPGLDRVAQEMVCIPVGWWVSEENRETIADAIVSGW